MKRIFLLLFSMLLIFGCTHFEIHNEIEPEITIINRTVGLRYKLGNLIINDSWDDLENDKIEFIEKNKDNIKFSLYVRFDEERDFNPEFYYYINGILFKGGHRIISISEDLLLANKHNIKGFISYQLDGSKVISQEEIKVKNKYTETENEW